VRRSSKRQVRRPNPHPSGATPPVIPLDQVPKHVAIIMDGNGRWANERGLPRTAGHEQGEHSLFDVVEGAIEIGVQAISAYAFSTENWSRSADEVKFLMGFNRDVIRRRRDEMHELGVRVRWAGRRPRLWRSVIKELQVAEELTRDNDVLTLTMCVNYGGRAELADAARAMGQDVAAGRLNADRIDERTFAKYLYVPEVPEADLVWRTSGEQRLSNFMLWQAAYSEMVFSNVLCPTWTAATSGPPYRPTPTATAATAPPNPSRRPVTEVQADTVEPSQKCTASALSRRRSAALSRPVDDESAYGARCACSAGCCARSSTSVRSRSTVAFRCRSIARSPTARRGRQDCRTATWACSSPKGSCVDSWPASMSPTRFLTRSR
jgi:undecaprenyl diphosphate synthase